MQLAVTGGSAARSCGASDEHGEGARLRLPHRSPVAPLGVAQEPEDVRAERVELGRDVLLAAEAADVVGLLLEDLGVLPEDAEPDRLEETGQEPARLVEERGLRQVTDTSAIEPILDRLIAENPGQVETVKKNPKVAGWFTGQVMKATGGKANPQMVNELVAKKLGL